MIGTMWEFSDADGPVITREVYSYMARGKSGDAKFKRAAAGVRDAAVFLKSTGVEAERWVNVIHIGA